MMYLFHSSSSMGNLLELLKLKKENKYWATAGRLTPTMGHLHALSLIAKSTIYTHYNKLFICWAMLCHETRSCLQLRTCSTAASHYFPQRVYHPSFSSSSDKVRSICCVLPYALVISSTQWSIMKCLLKATSSTSWVPTARV